MRLQAVRSAALSASTREIAIQEALDRLMDVMTEFGTRCPNISKPIALCAAQEKKTYFACISFPVYCFAERHVESTPIEFGVLGRIPST